VTERDAKRLGQRLRKLRLDKGLTQAELALPHYTHAYVSTIEAGRRVPSNTAVQHFAAKLGIHPEELKTGRPLSLAPQLELDLQNARQDISSAELSKAESELSEVTRTAKRFVLPEIEARAHVYMALIKERKGEFEAAIERNELALKLLRDSPIHLQADALCGKARSFHLQGDRTHAIYLLETYLHRLIQEGLPDPDALIRVHTSRVTTYIAAGYRRQAGEAALDALNLEQRVNDPARLGAMHNMVARALLEQGDAKAAEDSLKKAQYFYDNANLEVELARARLAHGILLSDKGEPKKAREQLLAALETFTATNSAIDEARCCNELGRLEREGGHKPQASQLVERALELLSYTEPSERARAKRELGLIQSEEDAHRAEKSFRDAIELFLEAEERQEAAFTHSLLGDLLARRKQSDGCRTYRDGLSLLKAGSEWKAERLVPTE
jgi:transcriptional regulator with XRE-family HTH domain